MASGSAAKPVFLMSGSLTLSADRPVTKILNKKHSVPFCLKRCRDFTPLVYSVDGTAGRETKMAEMRLTSQLAWKWKREYSEMVGYVQSRMYMSVLRANTLLIWGSRERRALDLAYLDDGAAMAGWRNWRDHC